MIHAQLLNIVHKCRKWLPSLTRFWWVLHRVLSWQLQQTQLLDNQLCESSYAHLIYFCGISIRSSYYGSKTPWPWPYMIPNNPIWFLTTLYDSWQPALYVCADPYVNDATFALSMVFLEELGATGNKVGAAFGMLWHIVLYVVMLLISTFGLSL